MHEPREVRQARAALARATRAANTAPGDVLAQRARDAARDDYLHARSSAILANALASVDALGLTDAGRDRLVDTLTAETGDRGTAPDAVPA